MANSDSNQVQLFYGIEGSWGETPDLGTTLQEINYIADDLEIPKEVEESEALHTHRGTGQLPQVGMGARGSITTEMQIGPFTAFTFGLMGSTVSALGQAATMEISGQTITITSAHTFSAAMRTARWISVAGANLSGNNGVKKVSSWAGDGKSVTVVSGMVGPALPGGDSITISTQRLFHSNSSTYSFLIERKYGNLATPHYVYWTGMMVRSLMLSLRSKSRVEASWGFVGKTPTESAATSGDGSPSSKSVLSILTTNSNVGTIYENGSAISVGVSGLDLGISNGLRERPGLGTGSTLQPEFGKFAVGGTIRGYFEDKALLQRFMGHTSTQIEFALTSGTDSVINFYMPEVKLLSGNPGGIRRSSDLIQPVDFYALPNSSGTILQVDYFP